MKATGASLLGVTVTGTVSGAKPDNAGVPLLEAHLSFDFGDVDDLDQNLSNGPSKYAIDPNQGVLDVWTVTDEEADALKTGNRLVNFRGIKSNVDSIGGVTVNSLFQRDNTNEIRNVYTYTEGGYDMPKLDIDWNAESVSQLLTSDQIQEVDVKDEFMQLRLPSQEVEVRKRIVREELVQDDSLPKWKRSRVIDRPKVSTEVNPYLTVAFYPKLDVVDID